MPDESFLYVLVVIREMCPAQTLYVEEEKSNGLSAYYGAVTLSKGRYRAYSTGNRYEMISTIWKQECNFR